MLRTRCSTQLTAILGAVLLLASACSSGTETAVEGAVAEVESSVDEAAVESVEAEPVEASSDESSGGYALTCDEANDALFVVRSSNGYLTSTAAGNGEGADLDFDATLAGVEELRKIQDVEGIFGTMGGALDNIENDVVAASEGRIADMGGDYQWVTVTGVVAEVCE